MRRYEEFGAEVRRRFGDAVASTSGGGDLVALELEGARRIDHVVIMEDISRGERILEYSVERLAEGGEWRTLCGGESVGHKRIQRFDTVSTSAIRLRTTKAKAEPHVRRLAAHLVAETG